MMLDWVLPFTSGLVLAGAISKNIEVYSIEQLWWVARFGTVCAILKMWKTPMEGCYF